MADVVVEDLQKEGAEIQVHMHEFNEHSNVSYNQIFHYSKENCLLLIVGNCVFNQPSDPEWPFILKYDLRTQQISKFMNYPSLQDPSCDIDYSATFQCGLNEESDELAVIGPVSFIVNLKTRKITHDFRVPKELNQFDYHYPLTMWIPSPINQIHSVGKEWPEDPKYIDDDKTYHIKYEDASFAKVGTVNQDIDSSESLIIFIQKFNGLLLLNESNSWFCEINEKCENEWAPLPDIKGPVINIWDTLAPFNFTGINIWDTLVISVVNNRLFVSDFDNLLHDKPSWNECDIKLPASEGQTLSMVYANGSIYFLDFEGINFYRIKINNIISEKAHRKYALQLQYLFDG
eukprot:512583_1